MKKVFNFLLLNVFMTLFAVVLKSGYAYDDGDWQYWNTESVAGTLMTVGAERLRSVNGKLETEFKWGNDVSEFYYQHTDLGIIFEKLFVSWFNLGIVYRQIYEYKHRPVADGGNYWYPEYRPYLDLDANLTAAGWSIKDRIRLEYRMFKEDDAPYKDDVWRVRNKVSLKPPLKWTAWKITPYAEDEIFVEEHKDGIYRNRVYLGLVFGKLFNLDTVKGDLYLVWQADDNGGWQDTYTCGTKVKIHF